MRGTSIKEKNALAYEIADHVELMMSMTLNCVALHNTDTSDVN